MMPIHAAFTTEAFVIAGLTRPHLVLLTLAALVLLPAIQYGQGGAPSIPEPHADYVFGADQAPFGPCI